MNTLNIPQTGRYPVRNENFKIVAEQWKYLVGVLDGLLLPDRTVIILSPHWESGSLAYIRTGGIGTAGKLGKLIGNTTDLTDSSKNYIVYEIISGASIIDNTINFPNAYSIRHYTTQTTTASLRYNFIYLFNALEFNVVNSLLSEYIEGIHNNLDILTILVVSSLMYNNPSSLNSLANALKPKILFQEITTVINNGINTIKYSANSYPLLFNQSNQLTSSTYSFSANYKLILKEREESYKIELTTLTAIPNGAFEDSYFFLIPFGALNPNTATVDVMLQINYSATYSILRCSSSFIKNNYIIIPIKSILTQLPSTPFDSVLLSINSIIPK